MSLRPYLLAVVAVGLAGLVVWDYWPAGPDARQATAKPKVEVVPALNPLSRRDAADFAALFDHPLFDPTRNKPATVAPVAPAATDVASDPVPVTPTGPAQPVLMGTVTSPWPGGAYLGDDAGGPVVFLRPGQASLGLHLEEVHSNNALFMGPEGEVTLTLHKTNAPTPAPMVTNPTAPATMPTAP